MNKVTSSENRPGIEPDNEVPETLPFKPRDTFDPWGADEFVALDLASTKPLKIWGDTICSGQLGKIIIPRGSQGIAFAYALAIAITYKKAFLEVPPRGKKNVTVLDVVTAMPTMQSLLQSQAESFGIELDEHLRILNPGLYDFDILKLLALDDYAVANKAIGSDSSVLFMVVDTEFGGGTSDLAGRDSISSWLKKLRQQGRTVIVVNYADVNVKRKRGVTMDKNAAFDFVIALHPSPTKHDAEAYAFVLDWVKQPAASTDDTIPSLATYAKINGKHRWIRKELAVNELKMAKVHSLLAQGLTQTAVAEELCVNKGTITRWLQESNS